MQIVSQSKDLVIPFSGARLSIKDMHKTQIIALTPNRQGKIVAEYSTYDKAKTVLMEVIANEASGERRVYYMPAE